MKALIKILTFIIAAMVQITLVDMFYEFIGGWVKKVDASLRGRTGARKHWSEYVIPFAHGLAIASLVVGGFRIHWVQGVAALGTLALIYGYAWWPMIKKYAILAYQRVMKLFGRLVVVKIQTPAGETIDAEFRVLAQGA